MAAHAWIVEHRADIDADFLAIYRIDLEERETGARRFLSLCNRLPAYQGAMAARVAAEQQEAQPQQPGGPASPDGPQELTVEQMALVMPGVIERVEV